MALALAGVLFSVITATVFIYPNKGSNKRADAVVVLDDGTGVRRGVALKAVAAGVAQNLVVSHHADRPQDCPSDMTGVTVYCFTPQNDNTQGEAQAVSKLAKEHGWTSIIFVTDPDRKSVV